MNMTCRVCRSTVTRPIHHSGKRLSDADSSKTHEWFRCETCKSFSKFNVLNGENLEQHHATRQWGREDQIDIMHHYRDPLYRYISSRIEDYESRATDTSRQERVVLDVGASFGGFLHYMREKDYRCEGTEVNGVCVRYLEDRNIKVYKEYELRNLSSQGGGGYSVITMIDVCEYFHDFQQQMTASYDLLAKGGILVVRTTNKAWMLRLLRFIPAMKWKEYAFRRAVVDHAFVAPAKAQRNAIEKAGFTVIALEPDKNRKSLGNASTRFAYRMGELLTALGIWTVPGVIIWARKY